MSDAYKAYMCQSVLISKFSKEDTQELSVACRYPALSHFSLICGAGVTSPETEGRGECPAPYSDLVSPTTKQPVTMMAIVTQHREASSMFF